MEKREVRPQTVFRINIQKCGIEKKSPEGGTLMNKGEKEIRKELVERRRRQRR